MIDKETFLGLRCGQSIEYQNTADHVHVHAVRVPRIKLYLFTLGIAWFFIRNSRLFKVTAVCKANIKVGDKFALSAKNVALISLNPCSIHA